MKPYSKQEFFIGLVALLPSAILLKWWGVVVAVLCGVLWVLGGTYHKAIRRWGVPALRLLAVGILLGWSRQAFAAAAIGVAVLYQGDGFPDHRPTTLDPGSRLGRFVERFIPDPEVGGPVTKWLVALAFQLSWVAYAWK